MRSILAAITVSAAATFAGTITAKADTISCDVGSDFKIEKTEKQFDVLYRGASVYLLTAAQLKDLFGDKPAYLECNNNLISNEMFAMVVGWKRDLLIAFGIMRAGGRITGMNVLTWLPHDNTFSPITLKPNNQYFIHYGRKFDLNTRICWNAKGDGRWTFSPNQRVDFPGACKGEADNYPSSQKVISIQSP